MKRFLKIFPLLLLFSTTLFVQQVQACGASPTARIVSTPNVSIIYSGDQILFSGTTSSANCGSINQYRWQVDGVTKSWSSSYTHTFTLAAGVVEQVFTVQLRVRNTYNKYGYKTIYITVRDNQSLYYITDHLGSVRVTVDEEGEAVTWDDYYPYGKRMAQRTQNVGDNNDDTKYTGYQYEDEGDLNLYHAGARLYDPEIGRFLSRDRFDAKYPSFTPYQYAANNPIKFVDVNGDSIDVSHLNAYTQLWLASHLYQITGVELEVNKHGMLVQVGGSSVNKKGTSKTARKDLMYAINHTETIEVEIRSESDGQNGKGSKCDCKRGNNTIYLNLDDIMFGEQNSEGVSALTLGIGMTFLHELNHSKLGFNKEFTPHDGGGVNDPVISRVNIYRREIGVSTMGVRLSHSSYPPIEAGGNRYLDFSIGKVFRRHTNDPGPYWNKFGVKKKVWR